MSSNRDYPEEEALWQHTMRLLPLEIDGVPRHYVEMPQQQQEQQHHRPQHQPQPQPQPQQPQRQQADWQQQQRQPLSADWTDQSSAQSGQGFSTASSRWLTRLGASPTPPDPEQYYTTDPWQSAPAPAAPSAIQPAATDTWKPDSHSALRSSPEPAASTNHWQSAPAPSTRSVPLPTATDPWQTAPTPTARSVLQSAPEPWENVSLPATEKCMLSCCNKPLQNSSRRLLFGGVSSGSSSGRPLARGVASGSSSDSRVLARGIASGSSSGGRALARGVSSGSSSDSRALARGVLSGSSSDSRALARGVLSGSSSDSRALDRGVLSGSSSDGRALARGVSSGSSSGNSRARVVAGLRNFSSSGIPQFSGASKTSQSRGGSAVDNGEVGSNTSRTDDSRVMLSQRSASGGPPSASVSPAVASSVSSSRPAPTPAPAAGPGLAEMNATVQKHAIELRRLAGVQRRHELESEYVRAELVRIRRDVKKLAAAGPSLSTGEPTPTPTPTLGLRSSVPPRVTSEEVLSRLALLEERVASLQEQRSRDKIPLRPLGLGTSPLSCVDDHFPAEVDDVTPTENGQLTEPLGFNLDDLALSDSDDH